MPTQPPELDRAVPGSYGIPAPAFRMASASRLGRVSLQVSDLDRSLEFYEDVLGLTMTERTPDAVSLGTAVGLPALVELHERPGGVGTPGGRLGLFHYAILMPDRASLGRFMGHLRSSAIRIGTADHAVSEALYLNDPDGLGIEVYADRPRGAWRRRGRELVMGTEPLDAPSLLRAAVGEPWHGMAKGTTIGHVHLHVGDLEEANSWYHQGLGLDITVRGYPGALFLSAGGYHHHLGVNTWAGPRATPPDEGEARLLDWEIILPTADAVAAAVRSLDRAGGAPRPDGDGAWVAPDPWGTTLRLVHAGK